jgi:hypothetical protein
MLADSAPTQNRPTEGSTTYDMIRSRFHMTARGQQADREIESQKQEHQNGNDSPVVEHRLAKSQFPIVEHCEAQWIR